MNDKTAKASDPGVVRFGEIHKIHDSGGTDGGKGKL